MMLSKVKKGTVAAVVIALFLSAFVTLVASRQFAQAEGDEPQAFTNYDVIYDSNDAFVGVNIKNSMDGVPTLNMVNLTANDSTLGFGVVTMDIGEVDPSLSTGLLLQFARLNTGNVQVRMYLEAKDGTMYRLFAGGGVTARTDVVIKPDGTVASMSVEDTNARHLFSTSGTLYVPWNAVNLVGSATPIAQNTLFTKLHFAREMRYTSSKNMPIALGTVATVDVDTEITVDELVSFSKMTYAASASDNTADINIFDMTKGTKAYCAQWVNGTHVFSTDSTVFGNIMANFEFSRMAYKLTVNYQDEEGATVQTSEVKSVEYDGTTGTFPYTLTVPPIVGYEFNATSSDALTGSLTANGEITLVYTELNVPKLTVEYKDGAGVSIKESELIVCDHDFETGVSAYEIETPYIFGYKYLSASASLAGTITQDTTVTLSYDVAFDDYDVVTNGDGEYVGVNLKNSMDGVFSFEQIGFAADTGYAFISMDIHTDVLLSDGLLIQFNRLNTGSVPVRMFVDASDGSQFRTFTGTNRTDLFITEDGEVSTLSLTSSSHKFAGKGAGTLYIPWSIFYRQSGSGEISEKTLTQFHFGIEMRNENAKNMPLALGTVAVVKAGATVLVEELINFSELTYASSAADETADINVLDMTKGKTVYCDRWATGSNAFTVGGDVFDTLLGNFKFSRAPYRLTVHYVDDAGETIQADEVYDAAYNSTTNNFPYLVESPKINGYAFNETDSDALTGTLTANGEITLVYTEVPAPSVTVKFVNADGDTIRVDEAAYVEYDSEADAFSYEIEPPYIFGYLFNEADKALLANVTQDTVVTLSYEKAVDGYKVTMDDEDFVGVYLESSLTGALVLDVTGFNADSGYGLISMDIGEVDPSLSTGLLLQFSRLNAGNAQVRMFIEASDGTMYKLFPGSADGDRDDVLMSANDFIDTVKAEGQNSRHIFGAEQEGTLYIPWEYIIKINGDSIAPGTVFTKFHFGREMRYSSTTNKPIALGKLAVVKVGEEVLVENLIDFTTLTYTTDKDNATADVNLADMTKGKTVYCNRWLTGTHGNGTAEGMLEKMLELWSFERMPARLTLHYVDKNGERIKAQTTLAATYEDGRSTYVITPAAIAGYVFVSASADLEGTTDVDMTVTLTYELRKFKITLEFVDANGNEIKAPEVLEDFYGTYHELEAAEIDGYTFRESTSRLNFTIMADKTIRLTYDKKGGGSNGCKSGAATTGNVLVLGLVLLLAFAVLLKKRNKEQ